MFLDSHCHLDRLKLDPYQGSLEAALASAHEAGVSRMLCIGIGLDNLQTVVDIAKQFEPVYASVGIHPSEYGGSQYQPEPDPRLLSPAAVLAELERLAREPKVIAIGETGLDFYHEGHDQGEAPALQEASFRAHLALAKRLELPVIVHTRQAQQLTLDCIREADSNSAGVLHCFTEDWAMATSALDMGYYVSISGIVTFKTAEQVREVAKQVPLDRLLLETDSPWLAPIPHRGKSNEPKYVADVFRFIAELRGVDVEALACAVNENFNRLFTKVNF